MSKNSKLDTMITDEVENIERLPIDTLTEFQGKLKTLSDKNLDKLINSIKSVGFSAPFFAYKGDKNYLLDGHQRLKALQKMREQGETIPDLPVVFIKAENKQEAKKKLLFITSQYGKPDQAGFDDFIADLDTDFLADIEIPDIDIDFDNEYKNKNSEISFDDNETYKITLKYDGEIYEAVKFAMEKRTESPEQIFREALGV